MQLLPAPGLEIDRLELQMTAEFEQVVRIYTDALPQSERKDPTALRGMLAKPAYEFLIAKQNGAVVGFSTTAALAGTNACVLEYMAVRSHVRSQGIGRALFRRSVSAAMVAARYVLLEVDSEECDRGESDPCARRHRFYRDLGCRRVSGLAYVMPLVTANAPPPMDLLVYRSDLPPVIDKGQLREWLTALYVDIYEQPRDDARIPNMLRLLPDEVRLV